MKIQSMYPTPHPSNVVTHIFSFLFAKHALTKCRKIPRINEYRYLVAQINSVFFINGIMITHDVYIFFLNINLLYALSKCTIPIKFNKKHSLVP